MTTPKPRRPTKSTENTAATAPSERPRTRSETRTRTSSLAAPADGGQETVSPLLSIGDLAAEAGVTTRTIRFYEARGLIQPARVGGARRYGRRERARLLLILRGKNLGFSLEDIGEYLRLYDEDPTQLAQTRLLLAKVDEAIAGLIAKRADLDRSLAELEAIRAKAAGHLRGRKP